MHHGAGDASRTNWSVSRCTTPNPKPSSTEDSELMGCRLPQILKGQFHPLNFSLSRVKGVRSWGVHHGAGDASRTNCSVSRCKTRITQTLEATTYQRRRVTIGINPPRFGGGELCTRTRFFCTRIVNILP